MIRIILCSFIMCLMAPGAPCESASKNCTGKKKILSSHETPSQILTDATTTFDANNISMRMRNSGQLIDYFATANAGFEWPKHSSQFAIYTGGLWIAGKVNGDLRIAAVQYDTAGFQPGTMTAGIAASPNNPVFQFYKISAYDTTGYTNWINAGAPKQNDRPLMKGAQNIWCVYNDGRLSGREFRTQPLKVEIQQYVYGDTITGAISNSVFVEYKISNRDSTTIESAYVALWIDADIGNPLDDAAGVDPSLALGYTYNAGAVDAIYGANPPAIGVVVFHTPSGAVPPQMPYAYVAYDPYIDFPHNAQEAYNYIRGLDKAGSERTNPVSGQPERFMFSGDPVAGTGWIDGAAADKAFLFSFGPFTLAGGDSTMFHAAIIAAQGANRLNSVSELRRAIPIVQAYYNSHLVSVEKPPPQPVAYALMQNYPNPFNPLTVIRYLLPVNSWVTLKVYNVLGQEVATLVNEKRDAGRYEVELDASSLSSGVYFYKLKTAQFVETKKLVLIK